MDYSKNGISKVLILSSYLAANGCTAITTAPETERYTHTCFTLLDGDTNSPLEGAYVSLTMRDAKTRVYSDLWNTTNASGKCCFEYTTKKTLSQMFASRVGYVGYYSSGFFPPTIKLTPLAYLQLHIKNIPPNAPDDQIGVTCPDASLNGSQILIFQGASVDTTVTISENPDLQGFRVISWISWHNGIRTDSTYNNLVIGRRGTFLEILY